MHWKRLIGLYSLLLFCFWVVVCQLYTIATNTTYAQRVKNQTIVTLNLQSERGDFFDRNGIPITGAEKCWYALCVPGESSYTRLFDHVDLEEQRKLYQKRNSATPFLVRVDQDLTNEGIFTVEQNSRYPQWPLCPHLIGYLDGDANGVAGLENAMDDVLRASGESGYIQCATNAQGALMGEVKPYYHASQQKTADVQLTIDSGIQAAVEGVGLGMMTSGAIVVLDTQTAQVLACASFPTFAPSSVASSIQAEDGALLNRAFSAYAVGSVFKPLLAAVALEENLTQETYNCPGYIDWHGHIYRCAGGVPHGEVDLQTALEKSCNGYFVQLGEKIGGNKLLKYARKLGFGQPIYITGNLKAVAGNLPEPQTLQEPGALANFSFGQGELLATPLQIAAMMNVMAGDGVYRVPTFITRIFNSETQQTIESLDSGLPEVQVFSQKTVKSLQKMLAGVVENGLGKSAAPVWGKAAGKTGTAQTGRFNKAGIEYKNLWFAGFYPMEETRYTIVVMQDDQIEAKYSSAAIFSRVCDAIYLLQQETEKG